MKPSIILVFLLISIPDFAQDWLEDKEDLKGKVIDETEKGYTLNGHVVRFAKVIIGE